MIGKARSTRNACTYCLVLALGTVLLTQFYAVRELLTAELIFALAFPFIAAFLIGLYLLGAFVEQETGKTHIKFNAIIEFVRDSHCGLDAVRRWFRTLYAIHAHK